MRRSDVALFVVTLAGVVATLASALSPSTRVVAIPLVGILIVIAITMLGMPFLLRRPGFEEPKPGDLVSKRTGVSMLGRVGRARSHGFWVLEESQDGLHAIVRDVSPAASGAFSLDYVPGNGQPGTRQRIVLVGADRKADHYLSRTQADGGGQRQWMNLGEMGGIDEIASVTVIIGE